MINGTPVPNSATVVYDFLRAAEGYRADLHDDTNGLTSIGIGFNIEEPTNQAVRDAVMSQIGFSPDGLNDDDFYYNQIVPILTGAGTAATKTTAINIIMAQWATDTTRNLSTPITDRRATFELNSEVEAQQIYNAIIQDYQNTALNFVTGSGIAQNTYEYAAILSLAYNNAGELLGPNLSASIQAGDHASAWYEIRYGSNGDQLDGIAKRRYAESSIFDSVGNEVTGSQELFDEYIRLARVLNRKESRIEAYDIDYIDGFNASIIENLAPANRPVQTITEIQTELLDVLRPEYLDSISEKSGLVIDALNAEGITVPVELTTLFGINTAITRTWAASEFSNGATDAAIRTVVDHDTNDLIFGGVLGAAAIVDGRATSGSSQTDTYTLNGGAGNDVFVIGPQTTVIDGGDGTDVLSFLNSDSAVTFDLSAAANISNVEVIVGSDVGDDIIIGSDDNNILISADGVQDILAGGDGEDTIINTTTGTSFGEVGNDSIFFETLRHDVYGGSGDDTILPLSEFVGPPASSDGAYLFGGEGEDTITIGNFGYGFGGMGADEITAEGYGATLYGLALTNTVDTYDGSQMSPSSRQSLVDDNETDILRGLDSAVDTIHVGAGDIVANFSFGDELVFHGVSGSLDRISLTEGGYHFTESWTNGSENITTSLSIGDSTTVSGLNVTPVTLGNTFTFYVEGGGVTAASIAGTFRANQRSTWRVATESDQSIDGSILSINGFGDINLNLESVFGTIFDDVLEGAATDDLIQGYMGADELFGYGGSDELYGGLRDDILSGGEGNDHIDGGIGNDELDGGIGDDVIFGGHGFDYIIASEGLDIVDGGESFDTVDFSLNGSGITYDLTDLDAEGYATVGDSKYKSVEDAVGTAFDDIFILRDAGNSIDGGDGHDIVSFAGSEFGIVFDYTMADPDGYIYAQEGFFYSIERVEGSNYDDTLIGDDEINLFSGLEGNDTISGGGGDDWLFGKKGADILDGGAGHDVVVGGHDFDIISGGDGDDWLYGGGGQDLIYFDHLDSVISGGNGSDTAIADTGSLAITLDLAGTSLENITGSDFGDELDGSAATHGMNIYGGEGADTLSGGSKVDRLYGEAGDDILSGGAGNDRFVYTDSWGDDQITDFGNGTDRIELDQMGITSIDELAITQTGADTLIEYGDSSILLLGIDAATINQFDFKLATVGSATVSETDAQQGFEFPDDLSLDNSEAFGLSFADYFLGRTLPAWMSFDYETSALFLGPTRQEEELSTDSLSDMIDGNSAESLVEGFSLNNGPIANYDYGFETSAGSEIKISSADLLANDLGENLTITSVEALGHGIATLDNGNITFTTDASRAGMDGFSYTVSDGEESSTTSVLVNVQDNYTAFDVTDANINGDIFEDLFGQSALKGSNINAQNLDVNSHTPDDFSELFAPEDTFRFAPVENIESTYDQLGQYKQSQFYIAGDQLSVENILDYQELFADQMSPGIEDIVLLEHTQLAALDADAFTYV